MAFFESLRTKNGNFFTIEWTLGEFALGRVIGFVVALIFGFLLSLIIPTLWLLIYFISVESQRFWINVSAILISLYFLLDYHFGWVCLTVLQPLTGLYFLEVVANYTTGLMLVHLTLLLFDRKIFDSISPNDPNVTDENRTFTLFVYTIIMCILGYMLGKVLLTLFWSQAIIPSYI